MILNHLNLTVTDVTGAVAFLEKYFGLHKQHGNDKFTLMRDDNGIVLSLMKAGQADYPPTFHIGFIQESEERVHEINKRMKDDGFEVQPPEQHHGLTFYVTAPGGFSVEVLA